MKINEIDLYHVFKLIDGDKIKITDGKMFNDGDILQVSHGGRLEIEGVWRNFGFSDLIGEEFEKVPTKFFEPVPYETAIRRMANEEETYIKYKGRYLKCILTRSLNDSKEKAIILMYDNCTMETIIDFVEALDYKFYVLM